MGLQFVCGSLRRTNQVLLSRKDSSMNKMRRMSTLLALMVTICISVDAKNSANATLKTPPRASDPTFLGVWADSAYPGILTTGTTLMILCYLTYVVFYGNHSFITTRVGKMNLYQILFFRYGHY